MHKIFLIDKQTSFLVFAFILNCNHYLMLRSKVARPLSDAIWTCTSISGCPLYVRKCTSKHGCTVAVQTGLLMSGCISDVPRTSVVAWESRGLNTAIFGTNDDVHESLV